MTRDASDPSSGRRRRRRWGLHLLVHGGLATAMIVWGLLLGADDPVRPAPLRLPAPGPRPGLTVGWGGSEGHSSCRYDAGAGSVEATLTVAGYAPSAREVTVTVTAYADENTSRPVGSATRTVRVDGTVREPLLLTVPVTRPPQVGEDDVAACSLDVDGAAIGAGDQAAGRTR
ncbi:hypothetical protein H5V45_01925 [Nocardioides sp. KIGAM211]|uniref:Uncharacterized protein n=1 Tax=Nocardioides luti TaxID=2761101 RepID=A0A7X0VAG0_9ACTN|nr:hypothetical protein [Nocardioides luti]MBB6626068.1 hypothetical protein [Nocardioides luti]